MKDLIATIMQPDGTMKCTQCGGVNFEAKRSTGRKLAFGALSLLGSTNELRCLACGKKYTRK